MQESFTVSYSITEWNSLTNLRRIRRLGLKNLDKNSLEYKWTKAVLNLQVGTLYFFSCLRLLSARNTLLGANQQSITAIQGKAELIIDDSVSDSRKTSPIHASVGGNYSVGFLNMNIGNGLPLKMVLVSSLFYDIFLLFRRDLYQNV